jgi:hypothetical protein
MKWKDLPLNCWLEATETSIGALLPHSSPPLLVLVFLWSLMFGGDVPANISFQAHC